ncbi:hypothetical protein SO802_013459 [Lithocarpus litseifolius]|uniref:Uncharacterized protein n=1 Tax=Lithocarpus litseifolius TaxID=425828 RepID=A0AAW2D5N2_9ROSI
MSVHGGLVGSIQRRREGHEVTQPQTKQRGETHVPPGGAGAGAPQHRRHLLVAHIMKNKHKELEEAK